MSSVIAKNPTKIQAVPSINNLVPLCLAPYLTIGIRETKRKNTPATNNVFPNILLTQSKSCRQHGFRELCPCSPYGMRLSAYHR